MNPTSLFDVVVVAGGRGRRFGGDKVVHPRAGRRQVDVVVAAMRPVAATVLVAAGSRPLHVPDTVEVADAPDLEGPLAGVVAGLHAATTELVALVAADLVMPSTALLLGCAVHARTHDLPGSMPLAGGRAQPLHAVLRADLASDLEQAAARSGPGLVRALRDVGVVQVPPTTWRRWAPDARPERDIDTRQDLRHLQE